MLTGLLKPDQGINLVNWRGEKFISSNLSRSFLLQTLLYYPHAFLLTAQPSLVRECLFLRSDYHGGPGRHQEHPGGVSSTRHPLGRPHSLRAHAAVWPPEGDLTREHGDRDSDTTGGSPAYPREFGWLPSVSCVHLKRASSLKRRGLSTATM